MQADNVHMYRNHLPLALQSASLQLSRCTQSPSCCLFLAPRCLRYDQTNQDQRGRQSRDQQWSCRRQTLLLGDHQCVTAPPLVSATPSDVRSGHPMHNEQFSPTVHQCSAPQAHRMHTTASPQSPFALHQLTKPDSWNVPDADR